MKDGSREKGGLDAPGLLASGGACWSPAGGIVGTVRRESAVEVGGLAHTGRNMCLLRDESGREVSRWGSEIGALDAPDWIPQGGLRSVPWGRMGSRPFVIVKGR